jgi:hypothetical protein
MNAFHPDYIKTYYPDFMKDQIMSTKGKIAMAEVTRKKRLANPDHGKVNYVPKATPVSLKPLEFMIYSRAGMPK